MRIGVVTTSYPRTPTDPAGSFVAAHVHALRALGHDVDVIAAGTRAGRDVVRIPSRLFERGGAPDALEAHPLGLLGAENEAAALRAPRWDSIVAHWLVPSALAALPSRAPLLAIAHGGDVHTLRRAKLLAPVLHLLAARGAELVFVSEQLRAIACAAAPRLEAWLARATVQPMGLDLGRFSAITRTPTDPPTVVVAARLVPIKGVDVMIDAVARLRTTARVVIAGDGPARAELEHRARAMGVTFLGQVDTAARDRLLGTASIVVVPSRVMPAGRSEGTPMIALEALAAGVPLIATDVGGLRALAPAAHLVKPEDPGALASAIDHILAAPPSPGDLQAAVGHLAWERIAPRLLRSG